ncbi:MAG: hypothetical protein HQ581_01200 [Planctomycetes bacterium]|nr:hypothetical protein [Planctomycetota bacterium]
MKVTTDPDTGVTTCELSTQDRKSLAAAKTVFEKIAYHERGGARGLPADSAADLTGSFLAVPEAKPEAEA